MIGSSAASQLFLQWLAGMQPRSPTQLYLALGSGVTAGGLTEFSGTDYARQPIVLVATAGVAANATGVTFGPTLNGWMVAAVAVYDQAVGGTCWFLGPTAAATTVPAGQRAVFGAGTLTNTFA